MKWMTRTILADLHSHRRLLFSIHNSIDIATVLSTGDLYSNGRSYAWTAISTPMTQTNPQHDASLNLTASTWGNIRRRGSISGLALQPPRNYTFDHGDDMEDPPRSSMCRPTLLAAGSARFNRGCGVCGSALCKRSTV